MAAAGFCRPRYDAAQFVDVLLKLELAGPKGLRIESVGVADPRGVDTWLGCARRRPAGVRPEATRRCGDRASGRTPRTGSPHGSRHRPRRAGRRASPPPRTAAKGCDPVPAHRSWHPNPVYRRAAPWGRTTRHASTAPASQSDCAVAISLAQQRSAMPMRTSMSTNARSSPATTTTRADLKRIGKPRLNATTIQQSLSSDHRRERGVHVGRRVV